ncbi:MAG TPA: hypothetical protein PLV04_15905, partial [Phenylobacterium sp.]|nr:hypothetical protein [Phenylobacterium sp.]
MKSFALKRFAGLAFAAAMLGAPLAAPALAQEAAPAAAAPAAEAPAPAEAAPAPEAAPAATEEAAGPALLPHQAKLELDSAGAAWILTSTALVLLMTIPGLALFYGGMVRRKNIIATVTQSFAITCLVTVIWMAFTYSLAFGVNENEALNAYIGSFHVFFLNGVTTETAYEPEAETIGTRKVDVMTVKQQVDPKQPGAAILTMVTGVLFGPNGFQSRTTALADGLLQ